MPYVKIYNDKISRIYKLLDEILDDKNEMILDFLSEPHPKLYRDGEELVYETGSGSGEYRFDPDGVVEYEGSAKSLDQGTALFDLKKFLIDERNYIRIRHSFYLTYEKDGIKRIVLVGQVPGFYKNYCIEDVGPVYEALQRSDVDWGLCVTLNL